MRSATWRNRHSVGSGRDTLTRSGHTATLCGHTMVVVGGGFAGTSNIPDFNIAVLDLNTTRWSVGGFGLAFKYHSATLVDDKIWCIGGGNDGVHSSVDRKIEVFQVELVALQVHSVETSLLQPNNVPSHTWKHIAEFFEGKREIVVHGGRPRMYNAGATNQLYALDVDSKTWRKLHSTGAPPPFVSSHMSSLNVTGDGMFVTASYIDDESMMSLYRFDYSGRVPSWENISTDGSVPPGLFGGSMNLLHGRYLFLFGGVLRDQYRNDLYIHDIDTSRWTKGIAQERNAVAEDSFTVGGLWPPTKSRHSGIIWNESVLYVGGGGEEDEPMTRIHLLSYD